MKPMLSEERARDLSLQVSGCDSSRELDDLMRRVWRDYSKNSSNVELLARLKADIQSRRAAITARRD